MTDSLFRIRAWVHYVSANPINDDQLLLAKDVASLLETNAKLEEKLRRAEAQLKLAEAALEEAREVIQFVAGRQSYPSLDETEKARAFLEKWGKE